MPDLSDRPALTCPDCGEPYPGLRRAPEGATVMPVRLVCGGCRRPHNICLWIADVYAGEAEAREANHG